MGLSQEIKKSYTAVCDECGNQEEVYDMKELQEWIFCTESNVSGLRLWERKSEIKRYESFHVPDKKEVSFCSKECAMKHFKTSMGLFLSEIGRSKRDISR